MSAYGPAPQWLIFGDDIICVDVIARIQRCSNFDYDEHRYGVDIIYKDGTKFFKEIKDIDVVWPELQKVFTQGVK